MNLASALIKQVVALQDSDTWSNLKKHYLPAEYHKMYSIIERHCEKNHHLPTFEDLKFEIRDSKTKEQLFAIESQEVEADAYQLLEYLKNEYTQKELLTALEDYVENSVAFEDANESVAHLHQIVLDIEDKVDLQDPAESMQKMELFEDDAIIDNYLALGLNNEYDTTFKFRPDDLVLVGGRRGAGKSLTCANVATNVYNGGSSAIYFTIEMPSKSIMQRCCAVATGISYNKIKHKQLSVTEWGKIAVWWAARFQNSEEHLADYLKHRDFKKLHYNLSVNCPLKEQNQLDIVYDPGLTVSRIRSELDKKVEELGTSIIIVDYINKVKRGGHNDHFDWKEQVEVSTILKELAQEYETTVLSPYQIDSSGEARFAKGILDAADAAFVLNPWTKEDRCVTFECTKMRDAPETNFTSEMDWDSLKMGPESCLTPEEKKDSSEKTGEAIDDL